MASKKSDSSLGQNATDDQVKENIKEFLDKSKAESAVNIVKAVNIANKTKAERPVNK